MSGPYVDPDAAQQVSTGANQAGMSPQAILSDIANKYAMAHKSAQPTNVGDPSLMSYESQAEEGPHMQNMREAAEAAKQKYMLENNVDEMGNPKAMAK